MASLAVVLNERRKMKDTVYQAFLEVVEENPDKVAIIDGSRSITYGQLAEAASAIEAELPSDPAFVGIVMDHGAEMIAAMLAVLKAGAAYVPAEPDFPVDRIAFMLDECAADAVITQENHKDVVEGRSLLVVEPGSIVRDLACGNAYIHEDKSEPEDLAYVLYTSGTTGTPKGVSVENRNVCSYIKAFQNEFHPSQGDRMLQHSVCSFDIFVEEVFSTLLSGATLVVAPREICNDAPALIDFIDKNKVTIVDGFPYLMDAINEQERRPTTVRLYVSGGDVLHERQVSNLVHEAAVYNTYGPSETTCCASYFRCDGAAPVEDGTYPIGRPVLGMDMTLVDADGNPVAEGAQGEILISGPDVSRGYLGVHPEQANFIDNPDGTRSYLSGDIAYKLDDGNFVFLHRKDDQVMIEGRRVEAKEVENVLLDDEDIRGAVVMACKDEAGFSYLTAYVVPANGDFALHSLKGRMARKLASFMIPEFFVKLDEIPLNDHGKPDESKLPRVLKVGDRR